MKVIIINQKSEYKIVEMNQKPSLDILQGIVGGYIEWITIKNNTGFYVNEEGKFNKELNQVATYFWASNYFDQYGENIDDYISGDVIYLSTDEEGDSAGLTEEQIKEFEDFQEYVTGRKLIAQEANEYK
jgi:hypothetical protein